MKLEIELGEICSHETQLQLKASCFEKDLNAILDQTLIIWAKPYENKSSGICGQRRPRSASASAQSDQELRCPQTELLDAKVENKGPDDTLRKRRTWICISAFCACSNIFFRWDIIKVLFATLLCILIIAFENYHYENTPI